MVPPSLFELTVQTAEAEGTRLVAQWRRPGEPAVRRERSLQIDQAQLRAQVGAADYGEALGRMVFDEGVRELFAQARADEGGLRVVLTVEAPALRSLRWERLAGPFGDGRWRMLGQSQRTLWSQHLPSGSDRSFPPLGRRDLRALVVVANPEPDNPLGVEPFDEAEALDTVLEGLGEIPFRVLGQDPRAEGPPTLEEICRCLTAERYPLLHIVAHGAFSRRAQGETAIFLSDDEGKSCAVKSTRLVARLSDLSTQRGLPHLAFLAVCDSAKPEAEGALGGLGQRMVRELGMPAVVAMTERVTQATAFTLGRGFYRRLREHGQVDRALVEACVDVQEQDDVVVPALFCRRAEQPLFSEDLERPLTAAEQAAAVVQLDALLEERAPSLREQARSLAALAAVDPAVLQGPARRERDEALGQLERLCEDALELSFTALAHGRTPPPYDARCPFAGASPLRSEQREFFSGRDDEIAEGLVQLERRSVLVVRGPSGSGKTSLIEAGLLPRLVADEPEREVVRLAPGRSPGDQLDDALGRLEAVERGVLVVDPLEALWLRCEDEGERRDFIARVIGAASPSCAVILALRSDFVEDCAVDDELEALVRRAEPLRPLSADALRSVVEAQAQAVGLRFESGLLAMMLADVDGQPGAMSGLQATLLRLHVLRRGRWLRIDAYHELGTVAGVLTDRAEAVRQGFDEHERERLRVVMLELCELHGGTDSARALPRRRSLSQLYEAVPESGPPTRAFVDALADERLVVKSPGDEPGGVVELAHEGLLERWSVLREWLYAVRATEPDEGVVVGSALADQDPDPGPPRRSAAVAIMGALVLLVVVISGFVMSGRGEPRSEVEDTPNDDAVVAAPAAPKGPTSTTLPTTEPTEEATPMPTPTPSPTPSSESEGGEASTPVERPTEEATSPAGSTSSRPRRAKKCQADPKTVRAIQQVLQGKGCGRVSVTVKDGKLSVPSEGINNIRVSSRALRNCKGEIRCPD